MTKIGRPRTCECGECGKCRARDRARERYQQKSIEERRAEVARRNPERVRANEAARYYRHREKRLAAMRRYEAENPERIAENKRRWAKANPDKRYAHGVVARAIKKGELVREPCEVCGTERGVHAHHDDYSKPLEVRWLCAPHHNATRRAA